ncbi:MAG: O-methyltransferase [Xenophilus sp.]
MDAYFSRLLAPPDDVLDGVLAASARAGLPAHEVSPVQGKLLALLVRLTQARRVLEIGTLGGYSTLWMARALPEDGRIVTIERNPQFARTARENFHRAGIEDRVDLRTGDAAEVLPALADVFDLVFIDADKPGNPLYLQWALKLARPGTVIVGDNVVRGGAVVEARSTDASVQGVRRFLSMLAADDRLESTAVQTVGEKGWDGFSISVVKA